MESLAAPAQLFPLSQGLSGLATPLCLLRVQCLPQPRVMQLLLRQKCIMLANERGHIQHGMLSILGRTALRISPGCLR